MEVTSAAYPRGVRCTVGHNTPAIITSELPLIILLDEQTAAAEAARADFADNQREHNTQEETFERISARKPQRNDFQEPGTSGMGNVSDGLPLVTTKQNPSRDSSPVVTGPARDGSPPVAGPARDGSPPITGSARDGLPPVSDPAHGSLSLATDINQYPLTVVIRPYGYDKPLKPIYNVLDCTNGNIMGALEVAEDREIVRLTDDTGMHVLTATGGLLINWWVTNYKMNIVLPSNVELAVIEEGKIHFKSDNTLFYISHSTAPGKPDIKYFIDNHEHHRLMTVTEREDSIQLVVHTKLNNDEQFRVALLLALWALYTQGIQRRPMPYGILAKKSRGELAEEVLRQPNILTRPGGLTLRMACCINPNNWFADFLFMYDNKIAFILAKTGDRYEFRDVLGRTHFIATQYGDLISVYSSNPLNTLIGKIYASSSLICDANNTIIMDITFDQAIGKIEQNTEGGECFTNECYRIYSVPHDTQEGRVKIERRYHNTAISMSPKLSSINKIMILAFAASVSDREYRMSEQIVPRVQHYP